MTNLTDLPNIGPKVADQLVAVGIQTPRDLAQVGSREAWLRIQAQDSSACIHRLMALEGAIRGVKKSDLPDQVKVDLKQLYQEHRIG